MAGTTQRDDERLLPRPLRTGAVALVAACALVVITLGIRYHGGDRPGAFDESVYERLASLHLPRGPLTRLVDAVPPTFVGLVAVLTFVFGVRGRWRAAALMTLGPGLALIVTEVSKHVVGRTLDGMAAYPSGHTTGVASVVATLALLQLSGARRVHRAAGLGLVAVTVAAGAIGLLMVTLQFHYATDIIGGYCVALGMPTAVALAIDRVPHRAHSSSAGGQVTQRRDIPSAPESASGDSPCLDVR